MPNEVGPDFGGQFRASLLRVWLVKAMIRLLRHASRTAGAPYWVILYSSLFLYSLPQMTQVAVWAFLAGGIILLVLASQYLAGWWLWVKDRREEFDQMWDALKTLERSWIEANTVPPAEFKPTRDAAAKLGQGISARIGSANASS